MSNIIDEVHAGTTAALVQTLVQRKCIGSTWRITAQGFFFVDFSVVDANVVEQRRHLPSQYCHHIYDFHHMEAHLGN